MQTQWMAEVGLVESAVPCSSCGRRMLQHEVKTKVDELLGYGLLGSVCRSCRTVYCHVCLEVGGTPCPTCGSPTKAAALRELAEIGIDVSATPSAVDATSPEQVTQDATEGATAMPAAATRISKDEFTNAKLLEVYQQAYMDASIGADGNVTLTLEGIKLIAVVDPSAAAMRLVVLTGIKPQATRLQVLELCNRINDGLMMLRATCPAALPQLALMLDHYLVTDAGVTGEEVIDETRRFRSVVAGVPPLDVEHILA